MTSHKFLAAAVIVASLALLAATADATYAGDKPLKEVFNDTMHGNYIYSVGNSTYKGSIGAGGNFSAFVDVTVPENATIRYQRLYLYWAWSTMNQKAIYPQLDVQEANSPGKPLAYADRYVDNKGFVSSYDFFSGMDAYELPDIRPGENNVTVNILQEGANGSSISIYGIGLLVVYESAGEPERILQVNEGADMLYSSYGITTDMAASKISFDADVPVDRVSEAKLFLAAPSGGYSQYDVPKMNTLQFNSIPEENLPTLMNTILSVIFPNFKGKQWVNFFFYDYLSQLGTADMDIRPYLRSADNTATIKDNGDYLVLTNSVLSITLK